MKKHDWTTRHPRATAAVLMLSVMFAGLTGGVLLDRTLFAPQPVSAEQSRAGMESGAVGSERMPRPPVRAGRPSDRFAEDLGLTPSQRARFDSLMERRMQALRALHDAMQPRMDSLIETTRVEIDAILTPEQQEKLGAMRERIRRTMPRPEFGPPGRGLPGPGFGAPGTRRKDTTPGVSFTPRPGAPVAPAAVAATTDW